MRIVYCIPSLYNSGGTERILCNKVNWLARHGYQVAVVTTDQKYRPSFFEFEPSVAFYDLGINYEDNHNRCILDKAYRFLLNKYHHKRSLTRFLKEWKPDITISMFYNEMSFLPKINDGSRKILEFHFCYEMLVRSNTERRVKKMISEASMFDAFVVLTEEDKVQWNKVLNNVQSINNFVTVKQGQNANLNSHKIIAVGRLAEQKAFDKLLDIWSFSERTDDWELHIWGDGPLRNYLTDKINELGLEKQTFLNGKTNDMESKYSDSSIFVMTSLFEGLPMSMIEAESYGIPVVTYSFPCGPKDIITDGVNGYLVDYDDSNAFSERLNKLMNNDDIRKSLGRAALIDSKRFTEDTVMEQWAQLFINVLNK